jgi:hypothetical protein
MQETNSHLTLGRWEMRAIFSSVVMLLLFAASAFAAQVYGTLRAGDRPVQQGVQVVVTCPGNRTYSDATDGRGGYRINVPEKGKCTIQVQYNGQAPTADIYSFDEATKYDFDLVQQGGAYALRRR